MPQPGTPSASPATALEVGRAAYARQQWRDAWEALSRADAAQPLDAADLHRLAWSAALIGRHDDYLAGLERLHALHLAAGDSCPAVRAAFWLGFRLLYLGEVSRGSAWVAQAEELLARHDVDCAERGYLLLPK